MSTKSDKKIDMLIQQIVDDTDLTASAVSQSMELQTDSMSEGDVNKLVSLLRAKNPPILGTGTVTG